jgi:hypothetical protein
MSSIPASAFASILPGVLSAGGSALDMNGLLLTPNTRVPTGLIASFANLAAVQAFFGPTSAEAAFAAIYFKGFTNNTALPGALLMSQFNQSAVVGYLRGGSVGTMTLAQLQALTALSLTVTVGGVVVTAASIALATIGSFSLAAAAMTTALAYYDAVSTSATTIAAGAATNSTAASITGNVMTVAATVTGAFVVGGVLSGTGVSAGTTILEQLTGTAGVEGTYRVSAVHDVATTTITQAYGLMTVGAMTSGTFAVGQTITGGTIAANTTITKILTGTGGAGTYVTSGGAQTVSATVVSGGQTVVTFDSVSNAFVITGGTPGVTGTISAASGTLAAPLFLTVATGATLSQGAAALTPATAMPAIIAQTTNWATFTTLTDPDAGYGNTQKQAFAAWNTATGPYEFAYVAWDTDITPTTSAAATASLGAILAANSNSGTELIWGVDNTKAAFFMGAAASINFNEPKGRITFAYKSQAGLTPDVTTLQAYSNLLANHYNSYVSIATANQQYQDYQNGTITGPFAWADSYINQIWLNAGLQLAVLDMLTSIKAMPYNADGYGLLYAAYLQPILDAVSFGAINTGVTLSASQIAQVNYAAGLNISTDLQTKGWYLQILPATAAQRVARGTPPCKLWYTDGGSIQTLSLASIAIQ